jgi:SAM-dependent methyltransferase
MPSLKRSIVKLLGFPDEGPDLLRYSMYQSLLPLVENLASRAASPGRVLCISGAGLLAKPFREHGFEIVETWFPDVDWHHLPFPDASFDVALSDQVLEHVDDPFRCVMEARRVVTPGGLQIHTTCFVNPVHGAPSDNWRFSPNGLRRLFPQEEEITAGGWGNPGALLLWLTPRLLFRPAPVFSGHPLHWLAMWNLARWPICTWYVGRSPASSVAVDGPD